MVFWVGWDHLHAQSLLLWETLACPGHPDCTRVQIQANESLTNGYLYNFTARERGLFQHKITPTVTSTTGTKTNLPLPCGEAAEKPWDETKSHLAPSPGVISEILTTALCAEDQGVILTNSTLQLAGTKPPLGTALHALPLSSSLWQEGLLHDSNHMEAEKGKCCFIRPFQAKS